MSKRALGVGGFIGIIVGAGLASGQEMLQFVVPFGRLGIVGAVAASPVMTVIGSPHYSLGSYI